jgi:hypothetical protein
MHFVVHARILCCYDDSCENCLLIEHRTYNFFVCFFVLAAKSGGGRGGRVEQTRMTLERSEIEIEEKGGHIDERKWIQIRAAKAAERHGSSTL